jgi:enamine deaminase RidA (YjgF/YER057c/UK114 family)
MIFVAGQIGWDSEGRIAEGGIVPQSRKALENILTVLALDGARAGHVVRLTWYVTDKAAYLAAGLALGVAYRQVMGKHFPAMSAVEVVSLMEPGALVEIEATAVVPESD